MSFSLSFEKPTKDEAKAELAKQVGALNPDQCPPAAANAIAAAIDAMPELEASVITVSSHGHIQTDGTRNTSNISVTIGQRLA